jgi:hypothetical protein
VVHRAGAVEAARGEPEADSNHTGAAVENSRNRTALSMKRPKSETTYRLTKTMSSQATKITDN